MFRPIEKDPSSVYEKILKQLTNAIIHGHLKPGDKLPSERTLANLFGVSRASLREALKMLAASGMIEIKHGQGVFIIEQKTPNNLLKDVVQNVLIDNETLRDLFEIRKLLETQTAVWACERASDKDIFELNDLVTNTINNLSQNESDLVLMAKQDSEFHTKLAEASGNRVLVKVMHDLLDLLNDSRYHALSIPERPIKSLGEHQQIVEALKARDVEQVKEMMLNHLVNVEKELIQF